MISLAEVVALVMLASLVLYALMGGADFGGGVWDLLATGPRAAAQRALIDKAIAPVWEANHVWLILVVVLLFSGFPEAYASASVALHVPLTLMLVGVVLRGSAFVFRHYGRGETLRRRWGRVFALASAVTPLFLGVIIAAVTSGKIHLVDGVPVGGFFAPWLGLFPFAIGLLTLSLFAFLAAVYLAAEATEPQLAGDFRARALAAGIAVGVFALAGALTARQEVLEFRRHLVGSWWSWPHQICTGAAAVAALALLWRRRYLLARLAAIAQVTLILVGWGAAQRPYLIAPDVTIAGAAAPPATLRLLVIALAIGAPLLLPSLYWLMRVFKKAPPTLDG